MGDSIGFEIVLPPFILMSAVGDCGAVGAAGADDGWSRPSSAKNDAVGNFELDNSFLIVYCCLPFVVPKESPRCGRFCSCVLIGE